jgi:cell division protein ZapE
MPGVEARYNERVAAGQLAADPAQAEAAARLQALAGRLSDYRPRGLFRKPEPVKGLYLWGGVGRGKSMLMDMFFAAAPTEPRRRVHFHEFMADVHDRLDEWRRMSVPERRRSPYRVKAAGDDPVPPVARQIAAAARLLCFDEFQVAQIADAMVLGRLFTALFAEGTVVVATSNRHPDDLYADGINRALFLPFLALIKERCEVFELASARDYRLERLTGAPVWHSPLGPASRSAVETAWEQLTLGAEPQHCLLTVKGRKLEVSREAAGVARFTFDELCARPLGPLDYLAIASNFHTLLVEDIPLLTPDKRNEAARFVALIDALYEARVKLVASAAAEPDRLYPEGDGAFEFARTASRLYEMRSADYIAEERRNLQAG